ncbi:hypothetical protein [Leisingera caerulea]|uniref:hypothetical protein n=1 Tax=Leisingera caerulea TaxID=506591 RepID=UPI0021A3611E|nr:hypothetical protein [Leisingera caerulea]UWQ86109.1 hypothetical protein K3726_21610 [Leisingera caerulea]
MQNSDFFQTQLARICQSGSLDTLVYLGAGKGGSDTVKACLDSGARHILLTEADPERAAALRPMCAAAGVQLREVAISEEAGRRPFHIFNIRSLSSCCRPDGLEEIFPGLRETGTVQVEADTITNLLDMPEQAGAGTGLLAIDCPGQEAMIIRQLQSADLLTTFQYIYLSLPAAQVYENSLPMAELLQLLQKAGWRLRQTENQDPDFPACFLELEPLALEVADLKQELAATRTALQASEVRAQDLEAESQRQAEELSAEAQKRGAAEVQAQRLTGRVAELEAETARQAQELEKAAAARDGARSEAKGLAARVAELEAEAARQAQELEEAAAARDGARSEAKGQAARVAELEAEAARQSQELEHRTRVSQNGLRRAEGQIELIKDLLLRGETL